MPALNWDAFSMLPGSSQANFELLCRGVVRQNFGSYGSFRALANQPGVEFDLRVDQRCDALGDPGRWWGWQCKWYDLPSGTAIGTTRRNQIEEGIRKTEAQVHGVTDWVLWTRRTLTSSDQQWFNGISSQMRLHLWTGDDVANLLVGQAAVLRSTYFGELILTPQTLLDRHQDSVAPIRRRWQPEVHHVLDAERELRRMLGEPGSWGAIRALADDLRSQVQAVKSLQLLPAALGPLVATAADEASRTALALERVADGIRDGDLDLLRDELSTRPRDLSAETATAPRRLRSGNHLASLQVTNAVGASREALHLLEAVEHAFATRLVAVLAPAGCGKTQLAAQLTVGKDARPHGVLLHGRDLHANHTLDDLARRFLIAAQPVPSMEALLEAVDAAGQRAQRRLPVVIDGLNEAEDPRAWKPLLAGLEATLARYPYVLLVCTLRLGFETEALPQETRRLEIPHYGSDVIEAIREHFHHYKIDATDVSIPVGLLKHPLTLRLFCEVTNPSREKVVGVDAMPGSLTALFERYLDQVGARIAELSPRTHRYYEQDVRTALARIGGALWEKQARSLEVDGLRQLLRDEERPWDQSIVRALEHEGVLLRMPSDGNGAYVPSYDRLGGHIVANALVSRHGQVGFESWIREASTMTMLSGPLHERHPLADDVVYSMVGQLPRRLHAKQLWQMVEEPLRSRALLLAAGLEAAYLDTETVGALLEHVRKPPGHEPDLLEKFRETRGRGNHPLNAEALDVVLRSMAVAERDLRWSEWIRGQQDEVLADLQRQEQRWQQGGTREGDRLRARWIAWTLTSTLRRLRDQATRALYWFGRVDPEGLFALTIDSLAVNDAYVSERALAASYGVVMSHQRADADFGVCLKVFLHHLAGAVVGPSATAPTAHYLARTYVRGIVAFAAKFYGAVVPDILRGDWCFGAPPTAEPVLANDPRAKEVGRTLNMDFENYTLGRLVEGRSNYDMSHPEHQAVVAHVRGVVWSLGWRAETFGELDRAVADEGYRGHGRGERPQAERYGKKYGWIGFFIYAGLLEEQGLLPDGNRRLSNADIDPSFPDRPPADGEATMVEAWLLPSIGDQERWMRQGTTLVEPQLLVREKIGEHPGPWVAVDGFVKATDRVLGREAWAFISALVTPRSSAASLVAALKSGTPHPWGDRDVPTDFYTFAGEFPWHPIFGAEALAYSDLESAYRGRVRVGSNAIVDVETLAHQYGWESYHSEMNQAGSAHVPSRPFSMRFDLRSVPQGFDQVLPDGTRAAITLSGVDGLDGDVLYVRKDLLGDYVGDRELVWFAFGERQLRPYPAPPPEWLIAVQREEANAWRMALREADLMPGKAKRPRRQGSRK